VDRIFVAVKPILKWVFALFFVLAGLNHFRSTDFYMRIMPPYLPAPLTLVYLSGLAEIALGLGLLLPRRQRQAAWGLIALLIAVFPANIYMVVHSELFPDFNSTLLWWRLPVQGLLIIWAYWYTGKIHPRLP
jgi:uncharacterized membrane protein